MAKKRAHRPDGHTPPAPTSPRRSPAAAPRPPAASRSTRATAARRGTSSRASSVASSRRRAFEEFSAPWLLRMQSLPSFVIPVFMGVLLFLGLVVAAPWAGILLIVIAVFLTWLTAVSWPVLSTPSRLLRAGVDVGVLGLGIAKLLGYLG